MVANYSFVSADYSVVMVGYSFVPTDGCVVAADWNSSFVEAGYSVVEADIVL